MFLRGLNCFQHGWLCSLQKLLLTSFKLRDFGEQSIFINCVKIDLFFKGFKFNLQGLGFE